MVSEGCATGQLNFGESETCEIRPPGGAGVDKVDCDDGPKTSHDCNFCDMENEDNGSKWKGSSYTIVKLEAILSDDQAEIMNDASRCACATYYASRVTRLVLQHFHMSLECLTLYVNSWPGRSSPILQLEKSPPSVLNAAAVCDAQSVHTKWHGLDMSSWHTTWQLYRWETVHTSLIASIHYSLELSDI